SCDQLSASSNLSSPALPMSSFQQHPGAPMRLPFRILALLSFLTLATFANATESHSTTLRVLRFLPNSSVQLSDGSSTFTLRPGEHHNSWTLVQSIPSSATPPTPYAVLEDFSRLDGHLLFVDSRGIQLDLPKSAEKTSAPASSLYLG